MITFRGIFEALTPSWLSTDDGAKVLYSVGLMLDATLEKTRQALLARFPQYTETEESLAYLGRDRKIPRGNAEPADRYAARLVAWRYPYGHRVRGNAWSLLDQLRNYFAGIGGSDQATADYTGNQHVMVADGSLTRGSIGVVNYDGGTHWARFVVVLDARASNWIDNGYGIGNPELWGGSIGGNDVIGVPTATQGDMSAIRQVISNFKPAGTQALALLVITSGSETAATLLPDNTPDGTWDDIDAGTIPAGVSRIRL